MNKINIIRETNKEMIYRLIATVWICGFAVGQDTNCNFRQEVNAGETFYFYNSGYPRNYGPGIRCRYIAVCPVGYNCRASCRISIPTSAGCTGDRFLVSQTGDPTLAGATAYCGSRTLTAVSTQQQLAIGVVATRNSLGGTYTCNVTTQQVPPTTPPPATCICGTKKTTRIVGGSETERNEYPMMAALIERPTDLIYCGATVISDRAALSAAHCLSPYLNRPTTLILSVGDHDLSMRDESNQYEIAALRIHENYNSETFDYDIGIVTVSNRFKATVVPVCLPFRYTSTDATGFNLSLLGYGLTEPGGMTSDTLQAVNVTVISQERCARTDNVTPRQFCTFTLGKDSCQHDSGGPALYEQPTNGRLYQFGIISNGRSCATTSPGIQTKVTSSVLLRWIINNVPATFCNI